MWSIPKADISDVTGRIYTINGKSYCRVTSTLSVISKDSLFSWYQSVGKAKAEKIIKNRQIIGTNVHTAFEHVLKGDYVEDKTANPEIAECVRMFKIFKYNTSLEHDALEQRIWNDEFGYAGTVDFIGTYSTWEPYVVRGHKRGFKDGLVILDYKTSRDIYPDYWLQVASYTYAFWKLTGVKPVGGVIVQFRDGNIRVQERTFEELMELFEIYKAVLVLYKWKYKL
jgi:hypothetical protein